MISGLIWPSAAHQATYTLGGLVMLHPTMTVRYRAADIRCYDRNILGHRDGADYPHDTAG